MALIDSPNAQYSFAVPRSQLFAFPPDVISRMLEDPSSHIGLMKLYQTCKYFWSRRPILIADEVRFISKIDEHGNKFILAKICCDEENISHLQVPLWITKAVRLALYVCGHRVPRFFRSSIKEIYFWSHLQFDDFVFLAGEKNVTIFEYFGDRRVIHSNGSIVSVDEILKHLPNIEKFSGYMNETSSSAESLIKLIEVKLNNKFKYFYLEWAGLHPTFDLDLFYQCITKNCNADTKLHLCLYPNETEKMKGLLANMDSKWRIEEKDFGGKLVLKDGHDRGEKKTEE